MASYGKATAHFDGRHLSDSNTLTVYLDGNRLCSYEGGTTRSVEVTPGSYTVTVKVYNDAAETADVLGPFSATFEAGKEYDIAYGKGSGSSSGSSYSGSSGGSSGSSSSGSGCGCLVVMIIAAVMLTSFIRQNFGSDGRRNDSAAGNQAPSSSAEQAASQSVPDAALAGQGDIFMDLSADAFADLSVQPDIILSEDGRYWAQVMTDPIDRLRMRSGPGTGYEIIDNIASGERVLVIGRSSADSNWVLVQYGERAGWCCVALDGEVFLEAVGS